MISERQKDHNNTSKHQFAKLTHQELIRLLLLTCCRLWSMTLSFPILSTLISSVVVMTLEHNALDVGQSIIARLRRTQLLETGGLQAVIRDIVASTRSPLQMIILHCFTHSSVCCLRWYRGSCDRTRPQVTRMQPAPESPPRRWSPMRIAACPIQPWPQRRERYTDGCWPPLEHNATLGLPTTGFTASPLSILFLVLQTPKTDGRERAERQCCRQIA